MATDLPYSRRYIYNLDQDVLDGLQVLYFDSATSEQRSEAQYLAHRAANHDLYTSTPITQKIVRPGPRKELETDFQTDFERYNRKRTESNEKPLTEEEFESKMDQLSISGGEDESEPETTIPETPVDSTESSISFLYTKSPLVLFGSDLLPSKCLGAYKTTLDADDINSHPLETLQQLNSPETKAKLKDTVSALFMIGGGHFAGAIISHKPIATKGNKGTPQELQLQSVDFVAHKTFHRYTTRRKQGGSQSKSDNARGKANSAGSSLRRYNEQALQEEVEELLGQWKPYLDKCEKIFVKASGAYAHKLLIGKYIKTDDPRLRIFPFTTKRPTSSELRRAWCELSYLKVTNLPQSDKAAVDRAQKQQQMLEKSRQQIQRKQADTINEDDKASAEVVGLLKRSKAPALVSWVHKHDVNMVLTPDVEYHGYTMLHYAAKNGLARMVQVLLVNLKADPTIIATGRTAAQLAADKQTKYAFQIARSSLGDDYCNWTEAKVGPPMHKTEVDELLKQEKEQQHIESQKLHQEKLQGAREEFKEQHDKKFGKGRTLGATEQQTLNSLSPEQRMRIMREQRARAAEARMKH